MAKRVRFARRKLQSGGKIGPHGLAYTAAGALAGAAYSYARRRSRRRSGSGSSGYDTGTGYRRSARRRRPYRSRSRSGVRRAINFAVRPQAGEFVSSKASFGKRKRDSFAKLTRLSTNKVTHRYQGVLRQNATVTESGTNPKDRMPGYFPLYLEDGTGTSAKMPVYVFNLTSFPSREVAAKVGYSMAIGNGGDPIFTVLDGQAYDGTTTENWSFESQTFNQGKMGRYIKTDWVDMRFLLYGARDQSTFYDIMVVKFKEDWLDPLEGSQSNAEQVHARNSFWQSICRNITYNCIMPGSNQGFDKMKIVKRYRKWIQPGLTTQYDTRPDSNWFKLFMRDDTIRNYNWAAKDMGSTNVDSLVQTAQFPVDAGTSAECRNNPHPRSRLWLIVRASNTTPFSVADSNFRNTPSFDLCIRRQARCVAEQT